MLGGVFIQCCLQSGQPRPTQAGWWASHQVIASFERVYRIGFGILNIGGIERALGRQAAESMAILPFGARDARQRQLIESEVGFSIQRAVDVIDKADNSSELRLVVASDRF